jgi:hypothetical protein
VRLKGSSANILLPDFTGRPMAVNLGRWPVGVLTSNIDLTTCDSRTTRSAARRLNNISDQSI